MTKKRISIDQINSDIVEEYKKRYLANQEPIAVNFRGKFPELNYADRYTHLIHSYPAKLLTHIPYFFINNSYFSSKGDTILDPFCGTGTVLLESIIGDRNALGADANPLAALIAEVKTTHINEKTLLKNLDEVIKRAKSYRSYDLQDVVNRDYWFSKEVQIQLAKLYRSIDSIRSQKVKKFFLVCYSNCIKKVSYADLRVSVPVKLNPDRFPKKSAAWKNVTKRLEDINNINVIERFKTICIDNIKRNAALSTINKEYSSRVISNDARMLTDGVKSKKILESESVNLIVTSPPYAGAQKYIRSSSLSLGWLGLSSVENLKKLDAKNIGRENFKSSHIVINSTGINNADLLINEVYKKNPTRAAIISTYLSEMQEALCEAIRVLKPNGYFVIIIGNNMVCNMEFNTQNYLSEFLQEKGLKLEFKLIDDIKSFGLMTKRNKTADIISREWILVFKK